MTVGHYTANRKHWGAGGFLGHRWTSDYIKDTILTDDDLSHQQNTESAVICWMLHVASEQGQKWRQPTRIYLNITPTVG